MKKAAAPTRPNRAQAADRDAARREAEAYVDRLLKMNARLFIALRTHLGLSRAELGARAGFSASPVRTLESASRHGNVISFFRLCSAAGIDCVAFSYEVERRLDAAGTPTFPDKPTPSERAFIKERCAGKNAIHAAEVRRQLRLLHSLTLPDQPAAPAKKRPRATARAR